MRCERASAYMRSKGINDVSQLSGGIHSYQETFPKGGYFHGKNFVFDPRIAVPSTENSEEIIGSCCICSKLFDDYSRQCRCSKCRVLILVCDDCALGEKAILEHSSLLKEPPSDYYMCHQCKNTTNLNIEYARLR